MELAETLAENLRIHNNIHPFLLAAITSWYLQDKPGHKDRTAGV